MAQTNPSPVLKTLRITGGVLIFLLGVVLAIPAVPGPGLVVMVIGLGMIHPPWGERIRLWAKGKAAQWRQRKIHED